MPGSLYVIGNGFDLHHDIPSSYLKFGEYVQRVDRETYRFIDEYLAFDNDFWWFFETRLADLDHDSVLQDAEQFFVNYSAESWRDSGNHDYQFEIERVVTALSSTLHRHFTAWVRELPIPTRASVESKLVRLDVDASFLTFNYTPTLERLYGIDRARVMYIHGSATDSSNHLVLGHGWNPADRQSLNHNLDPEQDSRIVEGNEIIDRYFRATFKPTTEIIARNAAFFETISSIDTILVMGHSLAEVDLPYFREIARHIDPRRVNWQISYHQDSEPLRTQIGQLGIDPVRVRYATLSDF